MASVESNSSETQSFYDDLASDYHLVYADWDRSIERQAAALDTPDATVTSLDELASHVESID